MLHWIITYKDDIIAGTLTISYVSSHEQLVDVLTRLLSSKIHFDSTRRLVCLMDPTIFFFFLAIAYSFQHEVPERF